MALIWTGTFDAPAQDVGILGIDPGIRDGGNKLFFESYPRQTIETDSQVVPQSWIHLVATYSDRARLFVNGIMVSDNEDSLTAGFLSSVTRLGRSQDFYVAGFEGVIDDVRIYNRALSDTEVAQLYNYESVSAVPEPSTYLAGICALSILGLSMAKNRKHIRLNEGKHSVKKSARG